jgi:hypothetical protein
MHFLQLVEVDTKTQPPIGNTKIEPLTSLKFPTEAYMNLKLSYMLASAVTNASNWIYDWLRSFSRYLTLPLWRTEKRLCKTG